MYIENKLHAMKKHVKQSPLTYRQHGEKVSIKMNVYVCEVRNNSCESMIVNIKATTEMQAKTICRYALRVRGYNILLKDINVMYIDNNRPPMNKN